MSDFIRRSICDGVAFSNITDDRFKIGRLSATLISPLKKETAAANALLSCVLTRSCKKYPDFTALNKKLDSLYGVSLYPSVRQIGDYQAVTISSSGIDDKYALDDISVSSEMAELLCSILFEPAAENGLFSDEDIEQERRQLLENIDAEYNDKRLYAIRKCVELMCDGEAYSIGRFGRREDVEALKNEDVYSAWKQLLDNARTEFTMLGNSDPENAYQMFSKYFGNTPRKIESIPVVNKVPGKVKRGKIREELSQSKLVLGLRSAYFEEDEDCLANSLMCIVLGGTPTSKLFLNVREKESLCYYCASRMDNNKGIMLIDSGVESENIEKTEESILRQLDLMQKGEVTEEELDGAKLALKNALMSSLDSLAALQGYYIGGILRKGQLSPEKAASVVDKISRERVIELANCLRLDTVFALRGEK